MKLGAITIEWWEKFLDKHPKNDFHWIGFRSLSSRWETCAVSSLDILKNGRGIPEDVSLYILALDFHDAIVQKDATKALKILGKMKKRETKIHESNKN